MPMLGAQAEALLVADVDAGRFSQGLGRAEDAARFEELPLKHRH
jgi:hypothetical protein